MRSLRTIGLLLLAAGFVLAAPLPRAAAQTHRYADLTSIDAASILPAPPERGSLAAAADLETVLQVQAARTPEEMAWARLVDKGSPWALFGQGNLLGPRFAPEDLPRLAALLEAIRPDLTACYKAAKARFGRPRPSAADSRVQPCVSLPPDASYPSGHTFRAYVHAAILAEIFPEKRQALFNRARSIAWARVVGGVHFPTDLEGGRRLAAAVVAAEFANPAFRAELAACRAEAAASAPAAH
jgi:acid phosphatase (class A)